MKTHLKVAVIAITGVFTAGGASLPTQTSASATIKRDVWTECQEEFYNRCMVVHVSHVFCADQTNMHVCFAANSAIEPALNQSRARN